jgi:hypothetical protein
MRGIQQQYEGDPEHPDHHYSAFWPPPPSSLEGRLSAIKKPIVNIPTRK